MPCGTRRSPRELRQISPRYRCENLTGLNMGRKHTYATKAQLETLVLRMHRTGILYSEALEEFKKQFILVVLRALGWNQSQAARVLGMHRRTLVRTLRKLKIDIRALRNAERRPPRGIRMQQHKKIAG
jgi:Fis family transcriptional regulator, factor for inversion stimulation protein